MKQVTLIDQESNHSANTPKSGLYSIIEKISSPTNSRLHKIIPYLGVMPYFLSFVMVTNLFHLKEVMFGIFGFHFLFLLLYNLLFVFPQITLEREFNMEEMLLSRISSYHYFFQKTTILLRNIFYSILIASITIVILSEDVTFSVIIPTVTVMIVRASYFVSIIIFIWRVIPKKNSLQSTLLSLFGLEIFGFVIALFIFPPAFFAFSPILSSFIIPQLMLDPVTKSYLLGSLWMNIMVAIPLFLASFVLVRFEIRFD